jgi:hypothetical protein
MTQMARGVGGSGKVCKRRVCLEFDTSLMHRISTILESFPSFITLVFCTGTFSFIYIMSLFFSSSFFPFRCLETQYFDLLLFKRKVRYVCALI